MIVVANSSPLVALVNIKQVEILPRLFGTVLIPPEVHSELLNLREVFDLLKNTDFWVSPALLDARLEAFEQKQAGARARQPGLER